MALETVTPQTDNAVGIDMVYSAWRHAAAHEPWTLVRLIQLRVLVNTKFRFSNHQGKQGWLYSYGYLPH